MGSGEWWMPLSAAAGAWATLWLLLVCVVASGVFGWVCGRHLKPSLRIAAPLETRTEKPKVLSAHQSACLVALCATLVLIRNILATKLTSGEVRQLEVLLDAIPKLQAAIFGNSFWNEQRVLEHLVECDEARKTQGIAEGRSAGSVATAVDELQLIYRRAVEAPPTRIERDEQPQSEGRRT